MIVAMRSIWMSQAVSSVRLRARLIAGVAQIRTHDWRAIKFAFIQERRRASAAEPTSPPLQMAMDAHAVALTACAVSRRVWRMSFQAAGAPRVSPVPVPPDMRPPVGNDHGAPCRVNAAKIRTTIAAATDIAGANIGIVRLREAHGRRGERERYSEHGHFHYFAGIDRQQAPDPVFTLAPESGEDRHARPFAHVLFLR